MSESRLQPGDRIAILGQLRSGKTTVALGHAARWINADRPVVYVYQADSAARIRQHIVAHTHTDDAGDLCTIAWCHRDDIIGALPNPLQDDTLIILDGWSDSRTVYDRIVDSVPPSVTVIQVCWTAENEDTTDLPSSFAGVFHPDNVFLPTWSTVAPATTVATEVGWYRIVDDPFGLTRATVLDRDPGRTVTVDLLLHQLVAWCCTNNYELRPHPSPPFFSKPGTVGAIWTVPTGAPETIRQHPTSAAPAPAIEIGTYRLAADGIHVSRTGHSAVTLAPHELVAWVTAGHLELRPDLGQHPPRLSGAIWYRPHS